ncbi:MAG: putative rane protein [Paenibacillus sp.]|nr:putative rane protein [Paenibacillus sp.]
MERQIVGLFSRITKMEGRRIRWHHSFVLIAGLILVFLLPWMTASKPQQQVLESYRSMANAMQEQPPDALKVQEAVDTFLDRVQASDASAGAKQAIANKLKGIQVTNSTTAVELAQLLREPVLKGYVKTEQEKVTQGKGFIWLANIAIMTIALFLLSYFIQGRALGVLINEQNYMSLSRFQTVIWTLLLLSAYGTATVLRAISGIPDAMDIEMDWHLWALLGISVTSLVGSPLIKSTKAVKPLSSDSAKTIVDNHVNTLKTDMGSESDAQEGESMVDLEQSANVVRKEISGQGVLAVKEHSGLASFMDLFRGEESANCQYLDLAKVQMFFFTIVSSFAYAVALFHMFATSSAADMTAFPVVSDGLVAILGISHAGYLTSKAFS